MEHQLETCQPIIECHVPISLGDGVTSLCSSFSLLSLYMSQHLVPFVFYNSQPWMAVLAFCPIPFTLSKTLTIFSDLVLTLDRAIWLCGYFTAFQLVKYVFTFLFSSSSESREVCVPLCQSILASFYCSRNFGSHEQHQNQPSSSSSHPHHSSVKKAYIFIILNHLHHHPWIIWWFTFDLL